jgi:HK97 family phage prohead protease
MTTLEQIHKTLSAFELKDGAEEGSFVATFSLFNVPDRDNDVTLPGAFTAGIEVPVAAWGHRWNEPAVGKGTIVTDDRRAQIVGRFFTETSHGADAYRTVKAMGRLQQWSYGFDVVDAEPGEFQGRLVRFLKRLYVHEVSPVLVGAQGLTHTDSIKRTPGAASDPLSKARLVARHRASCPACQAGLRAEQLLATYPPRRP